MVTNSIGRVSRDKNPTFAVGLGKARSGETVPHYLHHRHTTMSANIANDTLNESKPFHGPTPICSRVEEDDELEDPSIPVPIRNVMKVTAPYKKGQQLLKITFMKGGVDVKYNAKRIENAVFCMMQTNMGIGDFAAYKLSVLNNAENKDEVLTIAFQKEGETLQYRAKQIDNAVFCMMQTNLGIGDFATYKLSALNDNGEEETAFMDNGASRPLKFEVKETLHNFVNLLIVF